MNEEDVSKEIEEVTHRYMQRVTDGNALGTARKEREAKEREAELAELPPPLPFVLVVLNDTTAITYDARQHTSLHLRRNPPRRTRVVNTRGFV